MEFQERLFKEVNLYSRKLKESYGRLRPFERDSMIVPHIHIQRSNSYFSGHAAIAYVAARTFSILYPDKSGDFLKHAGEIAYDRILSGIHYPTGTSSGKLMGENIFEALMKSEKVKTDVKTQAR